MLDTLESREHLVHLLPRFRADTICPCISESLFPTVQLASSAGLLTEIDGAQSSNCVSLIHCGN